MNDLSRLEEQALVIEDFDEATDALHALAASDTTRAKVVAFRILREDIGDVYYQAGVFDVLYSVSAPDAVRYIEEVASTVDPYILGEMLTLIAVDVGYIDNRDLVIRAIPVLRHAMACRTLAELNTIRRHIDFFDESVSGFACPDQHSYTSSA